MQQAAVQAILQKQCMKALFVATDEQIQQQFEPQHGPWRTYTSNDKLQQTPLRETAVQQMMGELDSAKGHPALLHDHVGAVQPDVTACDATLERRNQQNSIRSDPSVRGAMKGGGRHVTLSGTGSTSIFWLQPKQA